MAKTVAPHSSPVRVFHCLPLRTLCGALSQQRQQSMVISALSARCTDRRRTDAGGSFIASADEA
jgi:hypothetical protein